MEFSRVDSRLDHWVNKLGAMRILLLVVLLSGCAPYMKLSGGHIISQRDDGDYRTGEYRANPCDSSFRGEIGLEKRVSKHVVTGIAYTHNSNIDCGWPRDDYSEYRKNSVEVSVKIGGVR